MAKKTKKEKILAEYRRKIAAITPPTPTVTLPKYQVPKTFAPVTKVVTHDYSYVTSDLVRIGILTALAICAQLVLWYLWKR